MPSDPDALEAGNRWKRYAASAPQIDEAMRQLVDLHAVTSVPQPIASAFVDWGAEPFGAAWHVWNAGVCSSDVIRDIVRPLPDVELYIAGEAYSSSQGWVEGALETAEAVTEQLASRAPDS